MAVCRQTRSRPVGAATASTRGEMRISWVSMPIPSITPRQTIRSLGAHQQASSKGCHAAEQKHRDAPSACHSGGDAHQGKLGEDCSDCHSIDDAHRGRFGEDCGSCHGTVAWKRATFDHDTKTRFPLRGSYREASCPSCHGASAGAAGARPAIGASSGAERPKLDMRCLSCHRVDDEHRRNHGVNCGDCHGSRDWKRVARDHQRDADFELAGAHRALPCESGHRHALAMEKLARDCYGCHASDDVHRGQEGRRFESCHEPSSWTEDMTFDEELTRLPLLGLHGSDDPHRSSFGSRCAGCHLDDSWEELRIGR